MKPATPLFRSSFFACFSKSLLALLALFTVAFANGCGSSNMTINPPPTNTSVVLMLSSTANAQLSQLNITFLSLTLTNQSGKTVTVFGGGPVSQGPQTAEFIHLNGSAEPLLTATVPADVYTAASATVQLIDATCVTLQPSGGLLTDEFSSNVAPVVTVSLPAPVRVTGTAMGLLLNLQVSQSVTPATCPLTQSNPTMNAAFTLTPVVLAPQPTNLQNGLVSSLPGVISSLNSMSNSFTVTASDGPTWTVQSNSNTQFQGVAAFSTLAAGMPVDFDAAIQSDGSLLATRVEVPDANPSSLTVANGPLVFVADSAPAVLNFNVENQGFLFPTGHASGAWYFSFGTATFQATGRFSNLQSLPFAASFTGTNIFPGQNTIFTSHAQTIAPEPIYIAASTTTLMPQTINGIVTATGTAGSFTTYTVSLASYDLIPALAVQAGQTTLINNPSTVTVYVDSSTQMLNTKQLTTGMGFRFNGLLFNDNGTLRLDAAQVNDGVLE